MSSSVLIGAFADMNFAEFISIFIVIGAFADINFAEFISILFSTDLLIEI